MAEGTPALVELAQLHDLQLAEILRGRLVAAGLSAFLFDVGIAGLLGGGGPGVRLMVDPGDAASARRLLDWPDPDSSGPLHAN